MPFPYPKASMVVRQECENRQISDCRETALLCLDSGKRVKCNLVDEIIGLLAPSDAAIPAIGQCRRDSGGCDNLSCYQSLPLSNLLDQGMRRVSGKM